MLKKTKLELSTSKDLIIAKNLDITEMNKKLDIPPIILPSYNFSDSESLSRAVVEIDNEENPVENNPVLSDNQKSSQMITSRKSNRFLVKSNSEFDNEKTRSDSMTSEGVRNKDLRASVNSVDAKSQLDNLRYQSENLGCDFPSGNIESNLEVKASTQNCTVDYNSSDTSIIDHRESVAFSLGKVHIIQFIYQLSS